MEPSVEERMAAHNDFGRGAEERAAASLQAGGWEILHRNWRWHCKEIDIVARRDDVVAFVEVRARGSARFGHPAGTIGWRKRRDLAAAAHAWAARHGSTRDMYRFDVITITGTEPPEHIEGAWQL
jgi:putative endonuclease